MMKGKGQTYDSHVAVNGSNPLVGASFEQLRCHHLLECQHDSVFASDADRGAAILDSLHRVFDLEIPTIW